jgi:hypothetical protein
MKLLPLVLVLAACNQKGHAPAGSVGSAGSAGSPGSAGSAESAGSAASASSAGSAGAVAGAGSAISTGSAGSAAGAAGSAAVVQIPAADDLCRQGMAAIDHSSCGSATSSLSAARKSLDTIVATAQQTGVTDPHAYEVTCARLVGAIAHDAAKSGCTITFDAGMKAKIAKDVEEYYGQRTPVTPTGDAAADAVIAKVAAMRDAACACKDQACLDKADKQLVVIPAMPATVPQAARDLATKLLDDASRCAQRVKMQ